MAKMSTKMANYIVAAYILYKVVMYFLNMRSSAMPNVPDSSSSTNGNKRNKQKGGCSTGTCGGN